jgi:DNA-binding transcriptional regulator YiaG
MPSSTNLDRRHTTDDKLFRELDANLKEAVKVSKGTSAPKSVYVMLTPANIKAIRASVKMSQAVFARSFQLSLDTVKGKADPKYVQRTLAA